MTATSDLADPKGCRAAPPLIDLGGARRLCVDLIGAEQERLLRERRISPRQRIAARLADGTRGTEEALEISEDDLGFDSLALLDLVGAVSRYFALADSGAEDLLLVHRTLGDWARIVHAHFERVGAASRIGFETSGSTGAPKRFFHAGARLEAEVDEILKVILGPLQPGVRILSAVPPRHIYGFLWAVLLPQRAGLEVVDLHASTGEALFRICRPGDLVVGTPFTWERAAHAGGRLPANVTGVTSAGAATPATWEAVGMLGLDRLIEIYGSTETGGVGWRDTGDIPFHLSERVARLGETLRWRASDTEVPLQDDLRWETDQRFHVTGRRDAIVKVAGIKVSTQEVVRILRAVDGVAEAAVRLDGDRIRALVVPDRPDRDTDALEDALRVAAARKLSAPARPDRYSFASALPRTPVGKLAAW
jgi:4-coumarate--CoA ligase (photoactive yellow protein activation family)